MAATTIKKNKVRIDPVARLIEPTLAWVALDNEDPERFYKQVHRDTMQISAAMAEGYRVEQYSKTGVRPKAIRPGAQLESLLGKDIEMRDCVLMSISKAERLAIEEAGRSIARALHAKIHNRGAVVREIFGNDIPYERDASGEPLVDVFDTSSESRMGS